MTFSLMPTGAEETPVIAPTRSQHHDMEKTITQRKRAVVEGKRREGMRREMEGKGREGKGRGEEEEYQRSQPK